MSTFFIGLLALVQEALAVLGEFSDGLHNSIDGFHLLDSGMWCLMAKYVGKRDP